jgi:hypothetical protein
LPTEREREAKTRRRYEEQDEEGFEVSSIHARKESDYSEHGHRDYWFSQASPAAGRVSERRAHRAVG